MAFTQALPSISVTVSGVQTYASNDLTTIHSIHDTFKSINVSKARHTLHPCPQPVSTGRGRGHGLSTVRGHGRRLTSLGFFSQLVVD